MKKQWIKLGVILSLAGTLLVTSGCGSKAAKADNKQTTEIKVGTSPGPYSELFTQGIKPILESEGYRVTEVEFSELLQADVALNDGSIDLNVDQHTAYLENFNLNKKADLVGITPIPTVPAGLFGGRKNSLAEVKSKDIIGIPEDASNTARALLLLEKAGWIKLAADVDPIQATISDVAENPHELDLVAMNSAQIPRSLQDLDYAVIPGSIVYSAGLNAEDSLLSEDILKNYELVATVKEKNKNSRWAKAVVKAYRSTEFKQFLAKENKNNYWYIPKELN